MRGKFMNEKSWKDFERTGKISDYLNYKLSNENVINQRINGGEIKPALPKDVGKPEESSDFCHRIVLYGREICTARSPKCGECPLSIWCKEVGGQK